MMVLRTVRERWDEWSEIERREEDERDRLVRLQAFRDAFIGIVALLIALLVIQPFLLGQADRSAALLALAPLGVITVAGLVWLVSWRMRGGGGDPRVLGFRAAKATAGLLVGYASVTILSWTGVIPLVVEPWSFVGTSAIGVAVGLVLLLLVFRGGDRQQE